MSEWQTYIRLIKESNSFKNRIRRYISDRDQMLGQGGQKNTAPFTKKMSTHVTFDKQLEEEVEEDTFKTHASLEPHLWLDEELDPKISAKLIKIAQDFIGKLPIEAQIEDIKLTGSLANYNWSKYSDVDLHLVLDFSKIDENVGLVKSFLDAQRINWNGRHNIKIHGYEVEIYVEDLKEEHKSSGIYSVLNKEWLIKPEYTDAKIDFASARKKSDQISTDINMITHMIEKGQSKSAIKSIDRIKRKIKRMRNAGLDSSAQEYSSENIAFKILRRDQTLKKLDDLKYDAYNATMSALEEKYEI